MLTICIALLCGLATGLSIHYGFAPGLHWSLLLGLLAAVACQVAASLFLRRLVQREMNLVQGILTDGQKRLQHKVAQWQNRPPGSIKQAQNTLLAEQSRFIDQALAASKKLDRFRLWSPMLHKQMATLRMQLYYQKQDYRAASRLLPQCLMLEPLSMAMKLALMYRDKVPADELEKTFEKLKRRLRYGQGAILYSLYAWILLRNNKTEAAYKTLAEAAKKMDDKVVNRNLELLANNRAKQFSNAGLGDEWYALGLETPRAQVQRRRR